MRILSFLLMVALLTLTARADDSVALQVHEILGIPVDHSKSYLSELSDVVTSKSKDPDRLTDSTDRLVGALLSGAPADELRSRIWERANLSNVNTYYRNPDWKYGAPAERMSVFRFILSNAKTLAKANSSKAKMYARASIVFAAGQDYLYSDFMFIFLFAERETVLTLTQLPPDQSAKLRALLQGIKDSRERQSKASTPALRAEAAIISSQGAIPTALVKEETQSLNAAWELSRDSPDGGTSAKLALIELAWRLRNLSVTRSSKDGIAAAENVLLKWKTEPNLSGHTIRSLEEAITMTGDAPSSPYIFDQSILKTAGPAFRVSDAIVPPASNSGAPSHSTLTTLVPIAAAIVAAALVVLVYFLRTRLSHKH